MINPLLDDLNAVINVTEASVWSHLRKKKIFITGGTGFFGTWLLECLVHANDMLGLEIQILVLSRDPVQFGKKAPHLFHARIVSFLQGDIRHFVYPENSYDLIIHAATAASEALNNENPLEMMDTIVSGTRNVLEFARTTGVTRMLYVSSGAVYGKQKEVTHIAEDSTNGPEILDSRNIYAEGKRLAESMCNIYADKFLIQIPVARCFAFVGPYLNLNIHFAIGNFIRDGLQGRTMVINGDGTPLRSYLYASDLMIWLLTICVKGESGRAYNVGSDEALSIEQLARTVGECFRNKIDFVKRQKPDPSKTVDRYVPSIDRATKELGLTVRVKLKEAVQRTIRWNNQINT